MGSSISADAPALRLLEQAHQLRRRRPAGTRLAVQMPASRYQRRLRLRPRYPFRETGGRPAAPLKAMAIAAVLHLLRNT